MMMPPGGGVGTGEDATRAEWGASHDALVSSGSMNNNTNNISSSSEGVTAASADVDDEINAKTTDTASTSGATAAGILEKAAAAVAAYEEEQRQQQQQQQQHPFLPPPPPSYSLPTAPTVPFPQNQAQHANNDKNNIHQEQQQQRRSSTSSSGENMEMSSTTSSEAGEAKAVEGDDKESGENVSAARNPLPTDEVNSASASATNKARSARVSAVGARTQNVQQSQQEMAAEGAVVDCAKVAKAATLRKALLAKHKALKESIQQRQEAHTQNKLQYDAQRTEQQAVQQQAQTQQQQQQQQQRQAAAIEAAMDIFVGGFAMEHRRYGGGRGEAVAGNNLPLIRALQDHHPNNPIQTTTEDDPRSLILQNIDTNDSKVRFREVKIPKDAYTNDDTAGTGADLKAEAEATTSSDPQTGSPKTGDDKPTSTLRDAVNGSEDDRKFPLGEDKTAGNKKKELKARCKSTTTTEAALSGGQVVDAAAVAGAVVAATGSQEQEQPKKHSSAQSLQRNISALKRKLALQQTRLAAAKKKRKLVEESAAVAAAAPAADNMGGSATTGTTSGAGNGGGNVVETAKAVAACAAEVAANEQLLAAAVDSADDDEALMVEYIDRVDETSLLTEGSYSGKVDSTSPSAKAPESSTEAKLAKLDRQELVKRKKETERRKAISLYRHLVARQEALVVEQAQKLRETEMALAEAHAERSAHDLECNELKAFLDKMRSRKKVLDGMVADYVQKLMGARDRLHREQQELRSKKLQVEQPQLSTSDQQEESQHEHSQQEQSASTGKKQKTSRSKRKRKQSRKKTESNKRQQQEPKPELLKPPPPIRAEQQQGNAVEKSGSLSSNLPTWITTSSATSSDQQLQSPLPPQDNAATGIGRGRNAILPAWMSASQQAAPPADQAQNTVRPPDAASGGTPAVSSERASSRWDAVPDWMMKQRQQQKQEAIKSRVNRGRGGWDKRPSRTAAVTKEASAPPPTHPTSSVNSSEKSNGQGPSSEREKSSKSSRDRKLGGMIMHDQASHL